MPVISVLNQKGGVGKTTLTLNLAAALRRCARPRPNVRAIDLDTGSCNLSDYAGRVAGVEIVTAEDAGSVEANAQGWTLLDWPAAVNPHAAAALRHTDLILIPLFPNRTAFEAMDRVLEWLAVGDNHATPVRGVLMNYSAYYADERAIKTAFLTEQSALACPVVIPRAAAMKQADDVKKSIFQHAPDSRAARAYEQLATEVMKWL